MPLRLVMMGTGRFALPVFRSLYESPHTVAGLFTQPDRTGRGHHRHVNPLKELAEKHGTPVFQPAKINVADGVESLRTLDADVAVVAAYGQILSAEVLKTPRLGCINLHASLLPKYRGAAPIHYAILNGETETGVSIFQIEPKLDAGPILGIGKTAIGPKETTGDVEARLAELAIPLTLNVLDDLEHGTTKPIVQESAGVTLAPTMQKSFGRIDWSQSAVRIANHVRAMQPWPGSFTFFAKSGSKSLRVILTDVETVTDYKPAIENADPGVIVSVDGKRIIIQTGDGLLEIRQLRPEGKREMAAAEFLNGHALQPGDRFVSEE